ncbi:MAG: hypothetical protein BJ554DRAFT_6026 [Olpidium bornovanus]|uniref:Pre-mRNA-splicing factor 38 n=1 Tax=Olpidium bornovanus TaxID=278681 RepID=A0A8H7ZYU5_9FUNG|nr:MAG: hypothetical protein BJ554DRAFT_6026 [Olpidium bornovanus]
MHGTACGFVRAGRACSKRDTLNRRRRTLHLPADGSCDIRHMDEFIDDLLREERVCDTILPRLTKREVLEETEDLPPRVSVLEEEDDDDEIEEGSKPKQ